MTTMIGRRLPALVLGLALAPAALGDSLGVSYAKHGKHGGVSIHWSSGFPACPPPAAHCPPPSYAPKPCPPPWYPAPKVWVPGHYEQRCEQVWVPGCTQKVWVEPVYELRYDSCGRAFRFCVAGGHWKTVGAPGHYETRTVSVWVPDCWR
jgi:hypothetical protein